MTTNMQYLVLTEISEYLTQKNVFFFSKKIIIINKAHLQCSLRDEFNIKTPTASSSVRWHPHIRNILLSTYTNGKI